MRAGPVPRWYYILYYIYIYIILYIILYGKAGNARWTSAKVIGTTPIRAGEATVIQHPPVEGRTGAKQWGSVDSRASKRQAGKTRQASEKRALALAW